MYIMFPRATLPTSCVASTLQILIDYRNGQNSGRMGENLILRNDTPDYGGCIYVSCATPIVHMPNRSQILTSSVV
jgi:hypothetical protein